MGKTSGKQVGHAEVAAWCRNLESADRSGHTVQAYVGAVRGFLSWYRSWYRGEEGRLPDLAYLTPTALLEYRNELEHARAKSTSTVNTRPAGLRSFCCWLVEHGHLPTDPSSRLKSFGRQGPPVPKGVTDRQVNMLLREASRSGHAERDYALVQVLLQTRMRIGECAALDQGHVKVRIHRVNSAPRTTKEGSTRWTGGIIRR